MGQSQLLLIVLSMIIIAIAIAFGNKLFDANATAANRDNIISDLNTLGTEALGYYKKPKMMGGGGRSFTSWFVPSGLDSTANGIYVANSSDQVLNITASGNVIGDDGVNPTSAKATVTSKEIIVTILN